MSFLIGLFLVLIAFVVIYGIWASDKIKEKYLMEGYRIFFHEKKLEIKTPFPMRGKPDIAFEHEQSGELLTGELKVRPTRRIYTSDRVQLSASRLLVAGAYPNKKVSDRAVMLVHTEGETHRVDVQTMDETEMMSLYNRFVALVERKVPPRGAENPHYCENCAFLKDCKVRSI